MYNNLKHYINDMKKRIGSHRDALERIKPELLLEKTGPLETAAIYFRVIEFNHYIKGLIKIRNEYKSLNLFRTHLEEKEFITVNTLHLTAETIDIDKDNFNTLIGLDFLKSKDRTLRLWSCDVHKTVILYEKTLNELEKYIDEAPDTWYSMYEHLEGPKFFLDKNTMCMYQMTNNTEDKDFSAFEYKTLLYNDDLETIGQDVIFHPDSLLPVFVETHLKSWYPEYLL